MSCLQPAQFFVCEYAPQGNVIGEFAYVSLRSQQGVLILTSSPVSMQPERPTLDTLCWSAAFFLKIAREHVEVWSCAEMSLLSGGELRTFRFVYLCQISQFQQAWHMISQRAVNGNNRRNNRRDGGCRLREWQPRVCSVLNAYWMLSRARGASTLSVICYVGLVLIATFLISLSCALLLSQAVRTASNRSFVRNFNAVIIGAAYVIVVSMPSVIQHPVVMSIA